ncbi:MAG: hypothetical protein AUJ49_00590 [Desulfovibrionaceae bacterium CG1_02_65_16]|nr:MAG: hypothetical protein AUJ49_00590 [Desulfovibrionaceae bacterium CG1_02_65_16]
MPDADPRLCVLVTGEDERALRRFLACYVKPALGLRKNMWRKCYRERYALTVLATPLRAGRDPAELYGRHAHSRILVAAALAPSLPRSGHDAARDWLKAQGFEPMVELPYAATRSESENVDQGALVVNFINARCPWRINPIDDLEAYMAKSQKPFWA